MTVNESENNKESIELINEDAYDYLSDSDDEDLLYDELLDEQEELEASTFFDDDETESEEEQVEEEEDYDDSELYSSSSLFEDIEEEEAQEPEKSDYDDLPDTEESTIFDEIDDEEDEAEEVKPAEPVFVPLEEVKPDVEEKHVDGPTFVPLETVEPSLQANDDTDISDLLNVLPKEEPLLEEEPVKEPAEEIKTDLCETIIERLPFNSLVRSYLKGRDKDILHDISATIEQARVAWVIDGKDKMFTIPDSDISVIVCSSLNDPMADIQRQIHAAALMIAAEKSRWNILFVTFDGDQKLADVVSQEISKKVFSDWQWKRAQNLSAIIANK
ncbi:MAG: hypothetical protein K6F82_01670 [Sphaerochaetaceae bacterium]|nr:hypothetical protein [Sphaerochaetaceae bacterium]